jgi:hypothetical protein
VVLLMPAGRDLFGLDIAQVVLSAFDGKLRAGVLRRKVLGERDPSNLAAGRPSSEETYPFQGIYVQSGNNSSGWARANVVVTDKAQVLIIGASIDVAPGADDVLELDDLELVVEGVSEDPAGATFTCTIRA